MIFLLVTVFDTQLYIYTTFFLDLEQVLYRLLFPGLSFIHINDYNFWEKIFIRIGVDFFLLISPYITKPIPFQISLLNWV